MVFIDLNHLICVLGIIQLSYCHRRIVGGENLNVEKNYAVYLVKAYGISPMAYTGWLCGGAIVSEWYIVTSAACIQDVKHLYAIAGYKSSINAKEVDKNECTKNTKKKIVFSCIPKSYEFAYQKIEKWAGIDIALVKVDTKFNFEDSIYKLFCSYKPGVIKINYDRKYQMPGTDAIVIGWGHEHRWRDQDDLESHNTAEIHYASVLIVSKTECVKAYGDKNMKNIIEKYMTCVNGEGNLDDKGAMKNTDIQISPRLDGCITTEQKQAGRMGVLCEDLEENQDINMHESDYYQDGRARRRYFVESNESTGKRLFEEERTTTGRLKHNKKLKPDKTTRNTSARRQNAENTEESLDNSTKDERKSEDRKHTRIPFRRARPTPSPGICQNDHGGPLVTWVGTSEVLIGVATAFIVSNTSECKGPYLFTSTQCNSAFLDCILNNNTNDEVRRRMCENPSEIGFQISRKHISWADHPSGPAKDEVLEARSQIPLQDYYVRNP